MRILKITATVLLWALQILLGAGFIAIGIRKFQDPSWVRMFARWGYPDGFYMVIGALELAAGMLLFIPRVASYGALLIAAIMVGAAATHAIHGETARIAPPLVFLVLVSVIGWCRRGRASRLSARQVPAATSV
jgi:putative oxidoreductase